MYISIQNIGYFYKYLFLYTESNPPAAHAVIFQSEQSEFCQKVDHRLMVASHG